VRKCAGAGNLDAFPNANRQSQSDKIQALIKAANVVDVEPIWASLFAKVRKTEAAHEFTIGPRESRRTG
jgi:ribosomal protein L12E/L44/L45/RPP1/RPP2